MDKENAVCVYMINMRILVSYEKERNLAICNIINGI